MFTRAGVLIMSGEDEATGMSTGTTNGTDYWLEDIAHSGYAANLSLGFKIVMSYY